MFSTLAGGKRFPGSISHRHKNVTFGKIAIGVAKGTAMIVIGVPVCTIAAGIGATAIVAYGLASPFYYGGKKLVRKIRSRRIEKKEELMAAACADKLTREDILIWLENCEESDYDSVNQDDNQPLTASSESPPQASKTAAAGATAASASGTGGPQRRKPTLRRLYSRESRGFLWQQATGEDPPGRDLDREDPNQHPHQEESQPQQNPRRGLRQKFQQYSELVCSSDAASCEESDQADLWKEMESVVTRLRGDRLSICPENVVTMDRPLLLTDGKDVLQFIQRLQLDGHLQGLTKATSMPNLAHSESIEEDLDQLGNLPGQQQQQQQKPHRKYKRTVSEGCGMTQRQNQQQRELSAAAPEVIKY